MNTLWVNGRFLDRPVTGVERVALEILRVLARDHLDGSGCLHLPIGRVAVKLLAPRHKDGSPSPFPNLPLVRRGLFQGHVWEQLDLPRLTAGQGLLSLCNTGPLLKREHWLYLHDAQPFAIPENFTPLFRRWYRLLFRMAGRHARMILVNSHFTRQELTRFARISSTKMRVCYPGSDHGPFDPPSRDACATIPDEPYVIAFASNNRNKNFRSVAAAIEMLGNEAPVCVVVGSGNARVFADAGSPATRVRQIGRIDDATLTGLYQRALCLVFPSLYEGFGLPSVEAMARGCPVIVADTSAMPEVVGSAAVSCNPEDPASLARAIRRMAGNPALRRELRAAGFRRAGRYRWGHSAAVLVRALAEGSTGTLKSDESRNPLSTSS